MKSDEELIQIVKSIFNFKPSEIIKELKLKAPIYSKLAAYGHFGRNGYPWEELNKVKELKSHLESIYAYETRGGSYYKSPSSTDGEDHKTWTLSVNGAGNSTALGFRCAHTVSPQSD